MSSFKNPGVQAGNNKPLRQFTVSDEELALGDEELNFPPGSHFVAPPIEKRELTAGEREELNRLRREQQQFGPRLEDYSKKRLEILINIGRLSKTAEFEGVSFGLRTLKSKETLEATLPIYKTENDFAARFELRRQSLSRSVFEIDGQSVELALGGSSLDLRLEMIDGMEEGLVEFLYKEFQNLTNESQNKYSLKTEQEVKAVVEDIKK